MNTIEHGKIHISEGKCSLEGVHCHAGANAVDFTIWVQGAKKCDLCLYKHGRLAYRIPMFSNVFFGATDLFCVRLSGEGLQDLLQVSEYSYESDLGSHNDKYMFATGGRDRFAKKSSLRGRIVCEKFDWSGENRVDISFRDMILYQCHLRAFTMHKSSNTDYPGTFRGFMDKLDYLQELGINTLLFLPLYDFNELMDGEIKKVNTWGYTKDAMYFAPKASFASEPKSASDEFKTMIKEIHKRGMNIFMDMYFEGQSPGFIVRCLRHYVIEYHIDGFMIDSGIISQEWLANDPILKNCKFLGGFGDNNNTENSVRYAVSNDSFQNIARRYLKSDEGQVYDFLNSFKDDRSGCGVVHYITQKNGFTMNDLVSYDVRHNEANGEKNKDGTEYNYSWNCGREGATRKKTVVKMRKKQIKNAFTMLFLGLATPMLLYGDEFGRTQKGNNNAYCQDNLTTWVDWSYLEKNREMFDFVKNLIAFRKTNKIYKRDFTFTGMDTKGYGVPDVSAHGTKPWVADYTYYSRDVAIMFYGSYYEGESIYIAFNFHWDSHEFFLPYISNMGKWKLLFSTSDMHKKDEIIEESVVVDSRSIVVLEKLPEEKKKIDKRKRKVAKKKDESLEKQENLREVKTIKKTENLRKVKTIKETENLREVENIKEDKKVGEEGILKRKVKKGEFFESL